MSPAVHDSLSTRLLKCYYPHLTTLQIYLNAQGLQTAAFLFPDDSAEYRLLIEKAIVASFDVDVTSRTLGQVQSEPNTSLSVSDVIQIVQAKCLASKTRNILTLGYRLADDTFESDRHRSNRIQNTFVNTNITFLQTSTEWALLLCRIGAVHCTRLLADFSIFVSSSINSQDCFWQIAGRPLSDFHPWFTSLDQASFHQSIPQPLPRWQDKSVGKSRHLRSSATISNAQWLNSVPDGQNGIGRSNDEMVSHPPSKRRKLNSPIRPISDIVFARGRMFHGRAVIKRGGKVHLGLPKSHALIRVQDMFLNSRNPHSDRKIHLTKYVFPYKFGLSNAFSSNNMAKPYTGFKTDLTSNLDTEIEQMSNSKMPARLCQFSSMLDDLLRKLSTYDFPRCLSQTCPSRFKKRNTDLNHEEKTALLAIMTEDQEITQAEQSKDHSLRSLISKFTQSSKRSVDDSPPAFFDYASGNHEVCLFVNSAVLEIFPRQIWGSEANLKHVLKKVKGFICARRFETCTLKDILQNFKISDCDWAKSQSKQRPTQMESHERERLVSSFLFWFIDSFIMDLLRTTFYITESTAFRNRVLFFRQDDWHRMTQPLLRNALETQFRQLEPEEIKQMMLASGRKLGFSYLRLLPKETGVRPITNLRRRVDPVTERNIIERLAGLRPIRSTPTLSKTLRPSINNSLQDAYAILKMERDADPSLVGSGIFGISDIYIKLRNFSDSIKAARRATKKNIPLYFVKMDIKACFDSIPQEKLVTLLDTLLTTDDYMLLRYSKQLPAAGKVRRSVEKQARSDFDHPIFADVVKGLASTISHAVLIDSVLYNYESRQNVLQLLRQHVTANVVKAGNAFYSQKVGIPQGSVISNLLCNLFFGAYEEKELKFTKSDNSVLLRMVDDFLFITTDATEALRFFQVLQKGNSDYGCRVTPEKAVTNFRLPRDVLRTPSAKIAKTAFPWCGLLIDTKTLAVTVDYTRYSNRPIKDSLSTDFGRRQGTIFLQKMLQSVKSRAHVLYTDLKLNDMNTVCRNIYQNFLMVALKFCAYCKEWKACAASNKRFFTSIVHQIITFLYPVIVNRAKAPHAKQMKARVKLSKHVIAWLGHMAFVKILSKKPAQFGWLVKHLRLANRPLHPRVPPEIRRLAQWENNDAFKTIIF